MIKRLKATIVCSFLVGNLTYAQNLFNPYSSPGFSYGYGFSPNPIPFDMTLSQMGLGIGVPTPYSYMYPMSSFNPYASFGSVDNPYDAFYNSYYSNLNSYPAFQQKSQMGMNFPSLFQDYFNKASAPEDEEIVSDESDSDQTTISETTDKETCKKSGAKTWNGSSCVTLENETDCNQELGHIWTAGVCKFKEELSKEECSASADTVWDDKCIDITSDKTFCDKYSELVWIKDKCYKSSKLSAEVCLKDQTKTWEEATKSCKSLSCTDGQIKFRGSCLTEPTKEYCLDPEYHAGEKRTWFHEACVNVDCSVEKNKEHETCVAQRNEEDDFKKCADSKGTWTEGKKDKTNSDKRIAGICSNSNAGQKDDKDSKEGKGVFNLFITSDTSFLKSDKKTDGQHPNKMILGTCLETINALGDRNIQYLKDQDQYSFRDIKKGQSGFSIINDSSNFFIEDRDLIKIRDENCKEEIKIALQNKFLEKSNLKCSINFKIGEQVHTVIFSKGNILANKPQFLITDSATGKHASTFKAEESSSKNANYKNLYLGIENLFKETTKEIKANCSRNLRKYTSDVFVGNVLNFSGACEGVLSTGWRDQDIDLNLDVNLKEAIRSCKVQGSGKTNTDQSGSNTSK